MIKGSKEEKINRKWAKWTAAFSSSTYKCCTSCNMNGFPPNCMKIICFDSKCRSWMLIRMINLWTDDECQMIKQTSKSMTIYSRSSLVNWPFQIESHSENCIFHKRIWFMRSKWNEFASLIFAWTARILSTLFFPLSQCDCEQFYPSDEIYVFSANSHRSCGFPKMTQSIYSLKFD